MLLPAARQGRALVLVAGVALVACAVLFAGRVNVDSLHDSVQSRLDALQAWTASHLSPARDEVSLVFEAEEEDQEAVEQEEAEEEDRENEVALQEDASDSETTCPSPHVAPDPAHLPLPLDDQHCRRVQTVDDVFTVRVCPLLGSTCNSFAVLVSRADTGFCAQKTAATNDSSISSDPKEAAFVSQELGPDAFELTIDGAQRLVVSWPTEYSKDACQWRYDVHMVNGGAWTLAISHMYSDFAGFRELWEDEVGVGQGKPWKDHERAPAWPHLIDRRITKRQTIRSQDFAAPISCPSSCSRYSFEQQSNLQPAASDDLPLCSRTDAIPHAYLPDEYASASGSQSIKYRGTPLGCRWSRPDVALLDQDLPASWRRTCLAAKSRRVMFQGDSHTRMAYDILRPLLIGRGEAPELEKTRHKQATIEKLTLEFVWDEQLKYAATDKMVKWGGVRASKADYLVLTSGAHQAFLHESTTGFLEMMQALGKMIGRRRAARRRTLFISTPSYPPKTGSYVYDNRDWRTNYRLAYWSAHSLAIMREMGVAVSDGFASTQPFDRLSPDQAHYRDTPAMQWWLEETMHKLALCSEP